MSNIKVIVPFLLMFSVPISAEKAPEPTNVSNSTLSETYRSNDMIQKAWNLSDEEMATYQKLIEKERAFTDVDSLSPYEVLGKHARTQQEKDKYARLFVQSMVNNHVKALEWSILVSKHVNDSDPENHLFASTLVNGYLNDIGYKKSEAKKETISLIRSSSRLAYYTDVNCKDCGSGSVTKLMSMVKEGRYKGIDIVFVGMDTPDQKQATRWAMGEGITTEMVSQRVITLNFESSAYKIKRNGRKTPLVLDTSNGRTIEIPQ